MAALRAANLLIEQKKGRQLLVRMPGKPKDAKDSRMTFYAIRDSIRFDA